MVDPYFLHSLSLAGFRAYLQPKTFDFSRKRCLAIFAPNGNGKSSIIDGLEFMFSKDGTLARLGQRAINNQAGPLALAHNLAEETKIAPTVAISIVSGKNVTSGARPATGTKRTIPGVAATVNDCFTVPPIIRGHGLRTFVEIHTPEQRYADVANWLQLGPLVEVQKNFRALRTQVKTAAEDGTALQRVDIQLARETAQLVKSWETMVLLDYVNTSILAPLDPGLTLIALATTDPAYVELEARAKAEADKIGLAGLRQVRNAGAALWAGTNAEGGASVVSGAIPAFDSAMSALSNATTKEEDERGKAANSAFQVLWNAAEPLFAEGAAAPDICPICATPVAATTTGSSEAIRSHIGKHLGELADYAAAKQALDRAKTAASVAHARLVAALPALIGLLGDDQSILKTSLVAYQAAIAGWPESAPPASAQIGALIVDLLSSLDQARPSRPSRATIPMSKQRPRSIDCWNCRLSAILLCGHKASWRSFPMP